MEKSVHGLSNFKASLQKNGIARNNRFEVTFHPPGNVMGDMDYRELSIRCHECSTPDFKIETKEYIVGQGTPRNMPVAMSHGHHVDFSFYNDNKSNVYRCLMAWFNNVLASKKRNDFSMQYYDQYATGKIIIKQLDEQNNVRMKFELHEAFPVEVDDVDYDSSETDMAQTVEVKVVYRYATFDAPGAPYSSVPDTKTATISKVSIPKNRMAADKDASVVALAKKKVVPPDYAALFAAAQARFQKTMALYAALIAHQQWTQNEFANQAGMMFANQNNIPLVQGIMTQVGNVMNSIKETFSGYSASVVDSIKANDDVVKSFPGTTVPGFNQIKADYNNANILQNTVNDKYNETIDMGNSILSGSNTIVV